MKFTAAQVFDATLTLAKIMQEDRAMPLKGKYRVARAHAKLLVEFKTISAQRDALIVKYGHRDPVSGMESVPQDKMDEFREDWAKIADEEIEVAIEAIPFAQLDMGDDHIGSITAGEIATLGQLISDPE